MSCAIHCIVYSIQYTIRLIDRTQLTHWCTPVSFEKGEWGCFKYLRSSHSPARLTEATRPGREGKEVKKDGRLKALGSFSCIARLLCTEYISIEPLTKIILDPLTSFLISNSSFCINATESSLYSKHSSFIYYHMTECSHVPGTSLLVALKVLLFGALSIEISILPSVRPLIAFGATSVSDGIIDAVHSDAAAADALAFAIFASSKLLHASTF